MRRYPAWLTWPERVLFWPLLLLIVFASMDTVMGVILYERTGGVFGVLGTIRQHIDIASSVYGIALTNMAFMWWYVITVAMLAYGLFQRLSYRSLQSHEALA